MSVPIPENEDYRLRVLQLYGLLDTAAERTLDELTRLAAAICETPIGLISLIDENRQWFKSRVGLEAAETPRDAAFCAHAIVDPAADLLIVEDAARDPRFAANPLVTGEPGIRFYAGAPLVVAENVPLGTLCVIDRRPRVLTAHQKETLRILSRAVVTQIELLRAREELRALEGLLPMCSWCRSVRSEGGDWQSLQEYVEKSHKVTHGICPDCLQSLNRKIKSGRA